MSVTCKIKVEFDMILLFSFVNIRQNENTHKMRNGNALAIQIHLIQYSGIILLCVTKENLNNNSHPNSQKRFFLLFSQGIFYFCLDKIQFTRYIASSLSICLYVTLYTHKASREISQSKNNILVNKCYAIFIKENNKIFLTILC